MLKKLLDILTPKTRLNKSLRVLVVVNMVMVFVVGLIIPFYAVYIEKALNQDEAFAGLSWAVLSIIAGTLILVFSKWGLKIKEQELLLALGYVIHGTAFLSYAFMTTSTQLLITHVLWGFSIALVYPAFATVFSAHTSQEESLIQWSDLYGMSFLASGIAALIGGAVIQFLGYQTMFISMAIISIAIGIYIWALPREML